MRKKPWGRTKAYVNNSWYQTKRLATAAAVLALSLIFILPAADRRVIIYKAATVAFAWGLWHLLRRQTLPYLDLEVELNKGGSSAIAAAILLGLTCLAVVLGISGAF